MRNGESANRPLEVVTRALLHCAQGKVGRANNYTCGSKFTLNIKMAGCGSRKFGCDISDTNRSGEKKKRKNKKPNQNNNNNQITSPNSGNTITRILLEMDPKSLTPRAICR